jgi:peptide/nickel transport system substrate-binding protein
MVPTRMEGDSAKLIQAQVYETLYTMNESVFTPVLAQSLPDCAVGGTTCVIKIAAGITFHNGNALKAQDVVYSINHLIEAKSTTMTDSILSAAIVDDSSLKITLKYPDGTLLTKLSNPMFAILPADSDADAKLEALPIGTGPYKFVSKSGKSSVKLTRFDTYHGDKALTKDVEFVVYADVNKALTALRDKEINLAANVPFNAKDTVTKLGGLQWVSGASEATVYLGVRTQSMMNSSLEALNFRKAVVSSIDRTALTQAFGTAPVLNLFGTGVFGSAAQSAKFPTGAAITSYAEMPITIVSPKLPTNFDVTANVADQLKKAGFTKVTVEPLIEADFQSRTSADKGFDLMVFVWQYALADGGDFVDSLFGMDSINRLRYQNSDLDSLILAANRTLNNDQRKDALLKIETLLVNEGVILPLTKVAANIVATEKITGISVQGDATIQLAKVSLPK